jgi:hypothetical protein
VLKFTVESQDANKPSLVALGLSYENLRRLRVDSIQFHGSEVGLGSGVFVIAHMDDPELPTYRGLYGAQVCELVVLTERVCQQFETGQPVVHFPLNAKRGGRPCELVLFAGPTEEALLEGMKGVGLVSSATVIHGPDDKPALPVSVFRVGVLYRLKLAAGAGVFIFATTMVSAKHLPGSVVMLMLGTAVTLLGMLIARWSERVEIDAESIRCRRLIGGFVAGWSAVASINAREDSLGPYELYVVERSGKRHKLRRIYARWDELIAAVTSLGR